MTSRRRVLAALLVVSAAPGALVAACSTEDPASPAVGAEASTLDGPAPDARRPVPDAEDVTCDAGDATDLFPPPPYAGQTNPFATDALAVSRGRTTFGVRCVLCHGMEGKGDGPEAPKDPPPADLTARRRSDDYLFWRITTGGRTAPFCSAMPSFGTVFTDIQRWQLVAFVQSIAPAIAADASADARDE